MYRRMFISEPKLLDVDTALIYLEKGIAFNSQNEFESAIITLRAAYDFFSNHHDGYAQELAEAAYFLGCSYKELFQYGSALAYIEKAYQLYLSLCGQPLKCNNLNLSSYLICSAFDLAQCRLALNHTEEAMRELTLLESTCFASKTYDDIPNIKKTIADIYLLLVEYSHSADQKTMYYLRRALEINPTAEAHVKFAMLQMQAGNYQEAAYTLTSLILKTSWQPNSSLLADALCYLGKCKLKLNSLDQALPFLKRAVDIYDQLGDYPAAMAATLGFALCCNKAGNIEVSDIHLKAVLEYSVSKSTIMHPIILDWCEAANFPEGFHLETDPIIVLNQLYTGIKQSQNDRRLSRPG